MSGENARNLDLSGRGSLSVVPERGVFSFTGKEKKILWAKPRTLNFSPADISDVLADGPAIHFTTPKGRCGEKHTPFYFYARDAGEAAEIVAILPATQAPDGERAFVEKLERLPYAAHPLTSVTNLLLLANGVVFLLMALVYGGDFILGKASEPFLRFGANNGAAFADGEWWRIPLSMFMHFGFWHLVLNLWALLKSGSLLERLLGRPLFTLAYFASGVGGGLASICWYGDKLWSAGASGAIFGVYGATLGVLGRLRGEIPVVVMRPLATSMVLFAGYNLLYGASHAGIDNACHVGGLLTGLLMGTLTALPLDPTLRARKHQSHLITGAAALAAIVVLGLVAAPRYDYRMAEEIATQELFQQILAEEKVADVRFSAAAEAFDRKRLPAKEFQAQAEEFGAFATRSAAAAKALKLTPGFRSDRRRAELLLALEKKVAAGKQAMRFSADATAMESFTTEFDASHQRLVTKLQALLNDGKDGDGLVRLIQDELLPFYAQAGARLNAMPLAVPAQLEARAKILAMIEGRQLSAQRNLEEYQQLLAWQRVEQEFIARYNELTDRLTAGQPRPTEALTVIDRDLLPWLQEWDRKFSAMDPTREEIRQAKYNRQKVLRNAILTFSHERMVLLANAARLQLADELKHLAEEFNELQRRVLPLTLSPALPEKLRDEFIPAWVAFAEKLEKRAAADAAFAEASQALRRQVQGKVAESTRVLRAVENTERFLAAASRVEAERQDLARRGAQAAKPALFFAQETKPAFERWIAELSAIELTERGMVEKQDQFVNDLRQSYRQLLAQSIVSARK